MRHIHLDESTATTIRSLVEPCSVFDAAGYFLPQVDAAHFEGAVPPFTLEELHSANEESGGRTLSKILADLDDRA